MKAATPATRLTGSHESDADLSSEPRINRRRLVEGNSKCRRRNPDANS